MLICYDLVALLLDGKTFVADAMVIALGITLSGEKVLLGFVQTDRDDLHPLTIPWPSELSRPAAAVLCAKMSETAGSSGTHCPPSVQRGSWCRGTGPDAERV